MSWKAKALFVGLFALTMTCAVLFFRSGSYWYGALFIWMSFASVGFLMSDFFVALASRERRQTEYLFGEKEKKDPEAPDAKLTLPELRARRANLNEQLKVMEAQERELLTKEREALDDEVRKILLSATWEVQPSVHGCYLSSEDASKKLYELDEDIWKTDDFKLRGLTVSVHSSHVRMSVPHDDYKGMGWRTNTEERVYFTEKIAAFIKANSIRLDEEDVQGEIRDAEGIAETARVLLAASKGRKD